MTTFSTNCFKGAPAARQAVRPRPGSCSKRGRYAGIALDGWESAGPKVAEVAGESRRRWAAAWPVASMLGRTARAAAAAPLPRTRHRPGHPPSRTRRWPRLPKRTGLSSRAGHPNAAKARPQGRSGLRPPRPLLRKGKPLTTDSSGTRSAPAGRTGESGRPTAMGASHSRVLCRSADWPVLS